MTLLAFHAPCIQFKFNVTYFWLGKNIAVGRRSGLNSGGREFLNMSTLAKVTLIP